MWRSVLLCIVWSGIQTNLLSCPFCEPLGPTLCEEIEQASVAVFGRSTGVTNTHTQPANENRPTIPGAADYQQFLVNSVLKPHATTKVPKKIDVACLGQIEAGGLYLITGYGETHMEWSNPLPFSPAARDYLKQSLQLPAAQTDRLAFFQKYLEHPDETIRRDAYDEFAKASYADLQQLGSKMNREQLLEWIADGQTSARRKRLYLTMLGVCGTAADVAQLEPMVQAGQRAVGDAFDALVACYLTLHGSAGLEQVRQWYLLGEDAEAADVYAVVTALRFHAEETDRIPRTAIAEALRPLARRPDLADLVIMDFARWEDWSLVEPLGELFPTLGEEHLWVRGPILSYLRACPLPEAKTLLADLEQLEPDSFAQAQAPWLALERKPSEEPPVESNPPANINQEAPSSSRSGVSWAFWLGGVLGIGLLVWIVTPTTRWRWQRVSPS